METTALSNALLLIGGFILGAAMLASGVYCVLRPEGTLNPFKFAPVTSYIGITILIIGLFLSIVVQI